MAQDKSSGKQVRDIKGSEEPKKDPGIDLVQGNLPILTVKLLEAINKNLITIIRQNAELTKLKKED